MPFDPQHPGYCPRGLWCRFLRWAKTPVARVWLVIILLCAAIGITVAVIEFVALTHRSANTATEAQKAALASKQAIEEIQEQRVNVTFANCTDQNKHKVNAVKALDHLVAVSEGNATPAARARAKASEIPIILLINALQPHRDCPTVVKATTGVTVSNTGRILHFAASSSTGAT